MASKKIRITKCSRPEYWYCPFVGEEIIATKILHNEEAMIHNSVITELRGIASLDGCVAKGDYDLI